MSTLDQGVQEAEALTDNLSAIAAQNQEANRNATLEVSSVEQLADSDLSNAQAQGQLNNFASVTTSSTTTTTSSSSTTALVLAAAQTTATQQSARTNSSGSCCCLLDEEEPQVLEVTLEDVGIRYGYDSFNQWDSEIYAFVVGRVSINIALGGSFIVLMNFGGQDFEVVIPSPLKDGGPGWYAAVVWVDDPWPPPYHQVFFKGTSLGQQFVCESRTLSVTGYRLGSNPFDTFDKRVSEVELPDPVTFEVCPYVGTLDIQGSESDGVAEATVSVDKLPFIVPLKVGVAYGDPRWRAVTTVVNQTDSLISVEWVWEGNDNAPETVPLLQEVEIPTAQFRYFNRYGDPSNSSETVFWAWDVFSNQYQLQTMLIDWRWNGEWEYVGPRWSNYYTRVTLWEDDYEPPSPYGGPPTYVFPEPLPVTVSFAITESQLGTAFVAYSANGGYSYLFHPPVDPAVISWVFTNENNQPPYGWTSNSTGSLIRYDVQDSLNCGGSNSQIQSGTATGALYVSGGSKQLRINVTGVGELQNNFFETTLIRLNDIDLISARSVGGDEGCEMGPIEVEYLMEPPYILQQGSHSLFVQYSTEDERFHVNAFVRIEFELI